MSFTSLQSSVAIHEDPHKNTLCPSESDCGWTLRLEEEKKKFFFNLAVDLSLPGSYYFGGAVL